MAEFDNPYAAPAVPQTLPNEPPLVPAGRGARFVNFFIDYIAQVVIGFMVGVAIVIVGGEAGEVWLDKVPSLVIGVPILLGYYVILEATTGRTLGKLITGTKVVREDGGTPTFGQILGRAFCRLIPFEAFSFFGTPPIGFHDSIPKTIVIKTR